MKKKLLCIVLCLCILMSLLLGACSVPEVTPSGSDSTPVEPSSTHRDMLIGTNFDPNDSSTWFVDTPSYPTEEDKAKIQLGMSVVEVFRILGLPQRFTGSSSMLMEWDTNTDRELQIYFGIKQGYHGNLTTAEQLVVSDLNPEYYDIPDTTRPPRKDPYYDPNDPMTWYSETPSHPTEEELSQIQIGMSMGSVFFYIGLPQRDVGSGKIILEWDLENGGHLQISFVKNDAYAYAKYPLATQIVVEKIEFLDCGYNPEDQSTWYSDTPVYPTAEDIAKIKPGMPVSLVFYAIGLPQRDVGSGNMILEWDLENGEHLQIAFVKNYANERLPLATHMVVENIESTDPYITPTFPPPTYYEPIYDPSDPSTWYSSTPSFPTTEGMARIQPGMAMTEVFRIIGLPQVNASHYECIMAWKVRSSGYLRITFVKKAAEAGLSATNMVVESLELVPTS